jgi:tetratricopeptide (TPR) repeat protein
MRARIGVLLGLAVLIAIAGSSAGESNVADLIARGDAYRGAYLYSIAADVYRQALDADPANPAVLLRLCDVSLRLGRLDEAGAYAQRAESAGAHRVGAADCRARRAEARGRYDEAAAAWSIVVEAQPGDRAARLRLIETLIAAHDWPAAAAQADVWLQATRGDASIAFYRAALIALDDPLRARELLTPPLDEEASALASALAHPLAIANRPYRAVSIGRVFLDHDRLSLAWRAFVAATTDSPSYSDAFAYLGITYERLGEATLAAAYLDRAVELDPNSALALYLRGVFLSRHARWDAAQADLERAVQIDPASTTVAFALGRALFEQGDYGRAEEQFLRALAEEPDRADWHLALAELYVGRLVRVADLGVPSAQQAADLLPGDARPRAWLGWGLHLTGDDARAEAELRAAIELDPASARARLYLGSLLIDAGRIEEGRTELMRAVDLDPQGEVGARARQLLGEP